MTEPQSVFDDIAALNALTRGIIPPDETDGGATMVFAGLGAADKFRKGINAEVYAEGLQNAAAVAKQKFGRAVGDLNPQEVHALLGVLHDESPAFFKQLRMDVNAAYLSDPGVWQHIGFPGPSTASGGYPDFDQPQTQRVTVMNTSNVLPAVQSFLAKPAKMLIGNQWREAASGEWIESPDPATGKTIGTFPASGEADVNEAVSAARRAFIGSWRKNHAIRTRTAAAKGCLAHREERRRTSPAHHAGKRQAALGSEKGSRHSGKLDGILRRLDHEATRRHDSCFAAGTLSQLHYSRAAREWWLGSLRRIIRSRCRSTKPRPRWRPVTRSFLSRPKKRR
jgi:hypothetical protein